MLLLAACLAYHAAEGLLGLRPTGLAATALLPVHLVGSLQRTVVLAAPASCLATLGVWHRLEMPDGDSAAGKQIVQLLRRALCFTSALVAALAVAGDFWARIAVPVYGSVFAVVWLLRSEAGLGTRRLLRAWSLFLPLIFEYKVLGWWARHACLADERRAGAYSKLHAKYAPLVFNLLAEQGGVFVKIGQLLSLLPSGVLPDVFTKELKKLQCAVPPRPGSEMRRLISEALGRPIEEIFSRFDEEPIGSASIGQVHRARIAADGREVVVKVQYPEVSRTIGSDFATCERVVWLLDTSRVEEVRQAKKYYINEIDFQMEAHTLERVHCNLRKPFPEVRVPRPVRELCTSTVLVMTYISGSSLLDAIMQMADTIAKARGQTVDQLIAEFTQRADADIEPGAVEGPVSPGGLRWRSIVLSRLPSLPDGAKVKLLLQLLSWSNSALNLGVVLYNQSISRLGAPALQPRRLLPNFSPVELSLAIWRVHGHQLLVDGVFSTDPHPGNIVVGQHSGELGLIDFGQVCELSLDTRVAFARLLVSLAAGDDREIAESHVSLGMRSRSNSVELMALTARMKYGDASVLRAKYFREYRQLAAKDPVLAHEGDEGLGRAERMINVLRGTSLILGVPYAHSPPTVWLEMARNLIREHGQVTTPRREEWLDKERDALETCILLSTPQEGKVGDEFLEASEPSEAEEFMDAQSDEEAPAARGCFWR